MGLALVGLTLIAVRQRVRHLRFKHDYEKLETRLLRFGCAIEDGIEADAKIRISRGSCTVYREADGIEMPLKQFYFSEDPDSKGYALRCAEELVDKLNEAI